MGYHLGVDVGTTWTAAAIGRDGRVEAAGLGTRRLAVPSVVCLTEDRLLVGEAAARRAVTEPQRVAREFKRRVGDPTPLLLGGSPVSAELCMARLVEWVVAQVAATEGAPPATLTLTHPANWGEYKLDLYRQALHHVDLDADRFVPEPVAAATAYAAQRPLAPATAVAVYDLGGGTFDAAVVRQGATGAEIVGRPDGIERLGGTDFDHAVLQHVLTSLGLDLESLAADDPRLASGVARLRESCVEAKEALSEETHVTIPVMLPHRHTEVLLTRAEFEAMIGPAVEETVVALRRTVGTADLGDDGVAAVLLVGGSSRIPLVGQLVGARVQRPIAVDARPKDAISIGAARVAMEAARTGAESASAVPLAGPLAAAPPSPAASGGPPGRHGPSPAGPGGTAPAPPSPSPAGAAPAPPEPPLQADDADRSARMRRRVAAALGTVIVLAAVAACVLVTRDGDDDDGGTAGSTTTTGAETTTSGPRSSTTTAAGSAPAPLPGDDWNDGARTQFLADCQTHLGDELALAGDPDAACACIYDDASADPEWTFSQFDEVWTSDDIDRVDADVVERFGNLVVDCGLPG